MRRNYTDAVQAVGHRAARLSKSCLLFVFDLSFGSISPGTSVVHSACVCFCPEVCSSRVWTKQLLGCLVMHIFREVQGAPLEKKEDCLAQHKRWPARNM